MLERILLVRRAHSCVQRSHGSASEWRMETKPDELESERIEQAVLIRNSASLLGLWAL